LEILFNRWLFIKYRKIWTASREDTRPLIKYDYTDNKLLYSRPNAVDSVKLFNVANDDEKTVMTKLDRPPLMLDGERLFYNTISRNISIPEEFRVSDQKSKRVIVVFKINHSGVVSDYHVKTKVGYGLDEAAVECIKNANGNWLPGMLNGKAVSVLYEVPITYEVGN
jgi:protein TonB